jgi:hypothetical protein
VFPNGEFFVKYLVQFGFFNCMCKPPCQLMLTSECASSLTPSLGTLAALINMYRIPNSIVEKWRALNANNVVELEEAERARPVTFGFEYSQVLLIMTITLFYAPVVPLVLPAGLLYLLLRLLFDRVCAIAAWLAFSSRHSG